MEQPAKAIRDSDRNQPAKEIKDKDKDKLTRDKFAKKAVIKIKNKIIRQGIILISIINISVLICEVSMNKFVDRKADLETLEEQYGSGHASLVVIYGRRRVGKTALITQFLKDKKSLYFLATEESEEQNRDSFQKQVASFTGDALLEKVTVNDWDILFDRLTQNGTRLVIALDEFQNFGKANPAFPSVFQRIWDTILSKRNVMVILCGSLISLMESQVLSYASPLYGRRTAQIRMTQIPFEFFHEFFPKSYSKRDLVELYSVTGGVPKYIESFDMKKASLATSPKKASMKEMSKKTSTVKYDIYQAIADNVLNRNSYLFDEPNFLLSKEVNQVGTYFSIIKAIAFGNRKSGEIAAAMNIKQTSVSKYLRVLEKLDILERIVPVTEKNPEKSKKGLYRIKDNYLRFWFRFVFSNLGLLETGNQAEVLRQIKRNFIDSQVSYVYEDVCRHQIWSLSSEGVIPFTLNAVGGWWGQKDVEIDIAALSEDEKRVVFGECKFWKKPVGSNVLQDLEEKASKALEDVGFKNYNKNPIYLLFSIEGFTQELEDIAADREDVILLR